MADDLVYELRAIARMLPDSVSTETCSTIDQAATEIEALERFIEKAFIAHPNLDLDIEALVDD